MRTLTSQRFKNIEAQTHYHVNWLWQEKPRGGAGRKHFRWIFSLYVGSFAACSDTWTFRPPTFRQHPPTGPLSLPNRWLQRLLILQAAAWSYQHGDQVWLPEGRSLLKSSCSSAFMQWFYIFIPAEHLQTRPPNPNFVICTITPVPVNLVLLFRDVLT